MGHALSLMYSPPCFVVRAEWVAQRYPPAGGFLCGFSSLVRSVHCPVPYPGEEPQRRGRRGDRPPVRYPLFHPLQHAGLSRRSPSAPSSVRSPAQRVGGPSGPVPGHLGASSRLTRAGLRLCSTFAARFSSSSHMHFGLSRDIVQGAAAQSNAAVAFPAATLRRRKPLRRHRPRLSRRAFRIHQRRALPGCGARAAARHQGDARQIG